MEDNHFGYISFIKYENNIKMNLTWKRYLTIWTGFIWLRTRSNPFVDTVR